MPTPERDQDQSPREKSLHYWGMHEGSDECPQMDGQRISRLSRHLDYETFAKDALRAHLRARVDEFLVPEGGEWPTPDLPDGTVIRFIKEKIDFTTGVHQMGDLYWGILWTDSETNEKLLLYKKVHQTTPVGSWTIARDPRLVVGAVMHTKQGEHNYAERIREVVRYGIRPPDGQRRSLLDRVTPYLPHLRINISGNPS